MNEELLIKEREMFEDLCWAVECHMATLSFVRDHSRTSKTSLRRHEAIVADGIDRVRRHASAIGLEVPRSCPQVRDAETKRL